jgi:hypothetical protein
MPILEPTNRIAGNSGIGGCGQAREPWPSSAEVTLFKPGQLVVWTYRPQVPPCQIYYVEAEVVHAGLLRTRIRLRDSQGRILLRWVKPERLRHKQANEAVQLYPARQTLR